MLGQDSYVREKLRELESARPQPASYSSDPPKRRRILAPIARRAGHRIRHVGEALEAWAAPVAREARG
jgi:hypothetical protein